MKDDFRVDVVPAAHTYTVQQVFCVLCFQIEEGAYFGSRNLQINIGKSNNTFQAVE